MTTTSVRPVYRLTARGVLAGEWTKFWSLRSSGITLAVSVVLLVLVGMIASASYDPSGGGGGPGGPGGGASDAVGLVLSGSTFASLAVGVLGVLLAAGEYSTGMIRSTLSAVPTRLPVLWSKALIAGGLAAVTMTVGAVVSFLIGSPLLPDAVSGLGLGDDGVLRSLLGAGLYLGLVAVLGVALGALVRSSAGGIAILAGGLLIVPGLISLLPASWSDTISPYLPSNAGGAIMSVQTADGSLAPWAGLAVFAAYVAVVLAAAAWRLTKTDA
ncbi:ABC transporter permease [Actinoplanes sp. LDG1-06]|uniref:ABC transporter permease n=1 Tax=Paractinoplanes ovalisporus TaxID=2810368 RepID=A0ABS2A5B5_9ACTN|nr:ABC transporter permease [Actinoplanes ovalisporus]MBM2615009.1 ABC transporter permease [Actinoplanes ovalisporus]